MRIARRAVIAGLGASALACVARARADGPPAFGDRLAAAAEAQCGVTLFYDPSYVRIAYPLGDVPIDRGVCADVVVRAYRALGIDLQERVHADMAAHFGAYPRLWGLKRPDANIDHRRVPNLETFFRRFGQAFAPSAAPGAYRPGDLVTWRLDNRLPHIGIVSEERTADGVRPLMVHNVGLGARQEDVLFAYPMNGHFRYAG